MLTAVPLYGVAALGWRGYLKTYLEPTVIMLPFNIIGEVSRTMALAVRLFGNMMSGAMIIAILLAITPFLFPVVMTLLGLADRPGAGLYFLHPGGGLHRRRHPYDQPTCHWSSRMDSMTLIAVASIIIAGITTSFGTMAPALAEGRAVAAALEALAQQPDASATITRTLFVGLAMIESMAIYCFVLSMILDLCQSFLDPRHRRGGQMTC